MVVSCTMEFCRAQLGAAVMLHEKWPLHKVPHDMGGCSITAFENERSPHSSHGSPLQH